MPKDQPKVDEVIKINKGVIMGCPYKVEPKDDILTTAVMNDFIARVKLNCVPVPSYPLIGIETDKAILRNQLLRLRKDFSFYSTLTHTFAPSSLKYLEGLVKEMDKLLNKV